MKFTKKTFFILIILILIVLAIIFFVKNKENVTITYHPNKIIDTKETSPFLPEGASVINKNLDTGIVIKDKNNNEWVWIEVPKSVTETANTDKEIEEALEKYVMVDSTENKELVVNKQGHTESYHEGTGLSEKQYNNTKSIILKSIKENGGFYVGRYETGYDLLDKETNRLNSGEATQIPVIHQDAYPYNHVTNEQAEKLSEKLSTEECKCSLMLGLQYDLIFKHINLKGKITSKEITEDSTKLGNYLNNKKLNITSKNAKKIELSKTSWSPISTGKINRKKETPILLTTGASDNTKTLNIYDIAGNVFEWTLEKGLDDKYPCSYLGGNYRDKGSDLPCSKRFGTSKDESCDYIGFRTTMY